MNYSDTRIEKVILATSIISPASSEGLASVKPEYFSQENHRILFDAIAGIQSLGHTVGIESVRSALITSGRFEDIGGDSFLNEIVSHANPIEFSAVCQNIRELWEDRVASGIIRKAMNAMKGGGRPSALLKDVANGSDVLLSKGHDNVVSDEDAAISLYNRAVENQDRNVSMLGHPTGIKPLDVMIDGWQEGFCYHFAARPSMGKTSLIMQFKRNLTALGLSGIFFSLETDAENLMAREMSQELGISTVRIKKGLMTSDHWARFAASVSKRSGKQAFTDDTAGQTVEAVERRIRSYKRRFGISWVMLDYMQLLDAEVNKNRTETVTHISKSLVRIARENDVFIIIIDQLNRSVDSRPGLKKPMLSDIRESGGVEQDAYLIGFLWRPAYYKIVADENGYPYEEGYTELIVAKHKDGPTGTIPLIFDGATMSFSELDQTMPF